MRTRAFVPAVTGCLGLAAVLLAGGAARGGAAVPYPEGYRSWRHVKSMVIQAGHPLADAFGGIHHVYANARGAEAARRGGVYPPGSVLVFDLLEARAEPGALVEGARKFVGVMVKDPQAYPDTGGWGFEAFKGDGRDARMVQDARAQCFACHQAQRSSDYVFSRARE